jgi:hypothetical protein
MSWLGDVWNAIGASGPSTTAVNTNNTLAGRLIVDPAPSGAMAGYAPHNFPDIDSEIWRSSALFMRLRIPSNTLRPFQHLSTGFADDKVFVFVVAGGKPVTLEDDAHLFPSDQLITQLRMLGAL